MAKQKAPQKAPLSVRLDPETDERLRQVSERTGINKHALAQMAIAAAIEAVEKNDYKIVLPINFDVKYKAVRKGDTEITYPAGRGGEGVIIEDRDVPKKPPEGFKAGKPKPKK